MVIMSDLSETQEEEAMRIHNQALVVDTHCDTLMHLTIHNRRETPSRRFGERSEEGHIDLPRMVDGGVDCQTFAIFTGRRVNQPGALFKALQMLDTFNREIEANDGIVHATTCEDVIKANDNNIKSAVLAIEGAEPLMGDLGLLRIFHKLGVRMLSFTWNWRTPFADGIAADRAQSKLPKLGIEALEEMDRLGIILDVSHISDTCFWDITEQINGPFIASHSNSRSICYHPRNLTDDMIEALADHGGVMGMNFAPGFVDQKKATTERLVDQIDHIVELVGPDHVGLGSDFDGISSTPKGLEDVTKMPNITRELIRREYSEEDIIKILGGNHLRLFQKVLR
jgi:membrane dipeptidase